MKKQINEVKRMQQLAGLITESQLNEDMYKVGDKAQDGSGNEVTILKGPVPFSDEILKAMEADWDSYAGIDPLDDPETTKGNWYYTEVSKIIHGGDNLGYKVWSHEDELYPA